MTNQKFIRTRDTAPSRPRYAPTRRVCRFCTDRVKVIDYKDVEKLRAFVSDRAKIDSRRRTGVCAKHQRLLAQAIKRARHLALLPYVPSHTRKISSLSLSDLSK